MTWFWLGVVVLIVVTEALTLGLVALWFLPGALIALALAALRVPTAWQIAVFSVMSIAVLVFGKRLFRPFRGKEKTNIDALIGQTAVITEAVCNVEARGAAKLGSQVWSARGEHESDTLEVGDHVTVVAIEGVKLICRKKV